MTQQYSNLNFDNISLTKESSSGIFLTQLKNELFKERTICIFGTISPYMAENTVMALRQLDAESDEDITIFINSFGGALPSAMAIIDIMRTCRSKIKTICIGAAYSAAALIFINGDHRVMYQNSTLLIHDPYIVSVNKVTPDTATYLSQDLKESKTHILKLIYENSTHLAIPQIKKMMYKDTYIKSHLCLDYGLVDEVIPHKKMTRRIFPISEVAR